MENNLLSIKGLCEFLSVSRQTVYRELNNGLPYILVGDSKRFERDVVLEYYKNKTKGGN